MMLIGVFIFSTITAMISSGLTDYILEEENQNVTDIIEKKSEDIMMELKSIREENNRLKDELHDLKKEIWNLR